MTISKKIALFALCLAFVVAASAALLLPMAAFAAETIIPGDGETYTDRYVLPATPLLYYRIDTDVRANSLPLQISAYTYATGSSVAAAFRIGYSIDDTTTNDIVIDSSQGTDAAVRGYRYNVPAYYSSSNNDDYEPRYHDGIVAAGATFYFDDAAALLSFDTLDVTYNQSRVLMSSIVADTDYTGAVSGTLKGATTYRLYSYYERQESPEDYSYIELVVYTGAMSGYAVAEGEPYTYFFSGNNDVLTPTYNAGYDKGYTEGASTSQESAYMAGYHNGREAGYSEGYLDGNAGFEGSSSVAKSLFGVVYDILSTPILGFISVADILLIIIVLAVVLFVLKLIRG